MDKPRQLSLFDQPSFNIISDFTDAANRAAKNCGLSREEIVDRMNDLADRFGVRLARGKSNRLTLDVFEKWLNPNDKSRVMPIRALPVFCQVVGDVAALAALARPLDAAVIGEADQRLLRWAKIKMRQKKEAGELRAIEKTIL